MTAVFRVAAEVADQPVARAGLGRDFDRDGEQALAAGHEQRAQPQHPGGERGRDRDQGGPPVAGSTAGASTVAASPGAGRRDVPAVHRDLHRPGAGHQAGRHRQAAHRYEALRTAIAVTGAQQLGRAVAERLDRVASGPADRFVQVQTPGAQRRLQVRHRLAQVAEQHGQVPVRARRGQRQLGRPDRRADGEHVADRAG